MTERKKTGNKGPVGCSYGQAAREIAQGRIQPVYLLFGPEAYLVDQLLCQIKTAWLGPEASPFAFSREDAGRLTAAQAVDMANQISFFAGRRLILLEEPAFIPVGGDKSKEKGGKALKEAGEEAADADSATDSGRPEAEQPGRAGGKSQGGQAFLDYLADPAPATCLVLRLGQGRPDRRNKLVSAIEKAGGLVEVGLLPPSEAADHLQQVLAEAGKKGSKGLLEQIAASQPAGLAYSVQELRKVMAYAGQAEELTPAMLREVLTPDLTADIFRLVDALGQKRLNHALVELRQLLVRGESPFGIFAMMLRQFRLIFRAKACIQAGYGRGQIAQVLGGHPFVAEKAAGQSKNFDIAELEAAFALFQEKDLAMKSSIPPAQVLEDLVIALGQGAKYNHINSINS